LEHRQRALLGLALDDVERAVDDVLGHRLLAGVHDRVHELRDHHVPELGIGQDLAFFGAVTAGHFFGSRYFGRLAPYLDRRCLRVLTPSVSRPPRRVWERTPGRSLTRPPRIITTECSWRLWPSPGMYEVTSIPLVRRTRATLRSAEFGFLGVVV